MYVVYKYLVVILNIKDIKFRVISLKFYTKEKEAK